ncbi:ABC-2 type transport system permease protein [Lentzea jiangxiensis]|uniref:ABC-2 type transport system permease protein n=2 Tax=Lentzea jiangxiensis TaxID=641025 RepID=A0A1H0EIW8_9PSEU|nr:ABC-2 type transport system permease protein [Lentzea jiangxiensis]
MLAGMTANVVFGMLRVAILAAALEAADGEIADYDIAATNTYVWIGQGLLGFVLLWGTNELAERVRSGDVVVDLYRPWHLQSAMLAQDLGRGGFAFLTRLAPPMVFGVLLFPFQFPASSAQWPLFLVSAVLALVVSFACRFLVDASAFWLLDNRGLYGFWNVTSGLLCGLTVPVSFFPGWARDVLWLTPFPALMQAPIDVFLGHGDVTGVLLHQLFWAVALLGAGHLVLQRAVRKVVVQGG